MSLTVLLLVLLAAALHAGWNALIKVNADRLVAMAILAGSTAVITLFLMPFFEVPIWAAWPYLLATSFIHLGYMFFLTMAYEHGDFGQVYPIARGTAPLLTALIGWMVIGEALSTSQWFAIFLITGGIVSLALHGWGTIAHNMKGVLFALGTAGFIASYTIVDASGARISGDVHGYTVWLFFLHGFPLFALIYFLRRDTLIVSLKQNWKPGVLGGAMSMVAYWIVLWAITLGAIAPVAALRETSVIFAALIAAFMLKEKFGPTRVVAAVFVAIGVYLLAISS